MASLIQFYNLQEWYENTFSNKEQKYIDEVIPFMSKENYANTQLPVFLALTECFIDVSFLPTEIWEKKLHIPVDTKIFNKALDVFYESESSLIEKHYFYNAVIAKRSFMDSVYHDSLIEKLCNEQIEISEAVRKELLADGIKLGNHEGFSTLIRIRKTENVEECKDLCNQAIAQGWRGGWKRTLNSLIEKEKQAKALESGNYDVEMFKKRLPLENSEFSEKYGAKNTDVYFPALRALERGDSVFFRIYSGEEVIEENELEAITFKRGDMFLTLNNGKSVKIPMNMVMDDNYIDFNHENFAASFFGSDQWRVSEESDVPMYKYMITTFKNDSQNPLLNDELPREDTVTYSNGMTVTHKENGFSIDFGNMFNQDFEDDESDNWEELIELIKERNDNEDIIFVSILSDDEDGDNRETIFSGNLKELNVDDDLNLEMVIDDKKIQVLETIDELDICFPENEDSKLLGFFPCSIDIGEEYIDVIVAFGAISTDEIEEDESDEESLDEEEIEDESSNSEVWNELYDLVGQDFNNEREVTIAIMNSEEDLIFRQELIGISFKGESIELKYDGDSLIFNQSIDDIPLGLDVSDDEYFALFEYIVNDENCKIIITNKY